MMLKLIAQLVALIVVFVAIIFAAAGTFDYWQAWLFLACYFAASVALMFWLARHDPALLKRRMRGGPFAEGERSQKLIMALTSLGFIAGLVVPGLDRRFGWSHMPPAVALLGDVLLLIGWLGIYFVFRANSYAAATIQVAPDQKVVSTGPYAVVRHPMYAVSVFLLLGVSLGLGSWWSLLVWVAVVPALMWRLLDEERLLLRDLNGYAEYMRKVRWRLIPGVW